MKHGEDDGRTIADMSGLDKPTLYRSPAAEPTPDRPPLSKREQRRAVFLALGAALLIVGIFIGAAALFILFCIHVWFK